MLGVMNAGFLAAQKGPPPKPLDGHNFISVSAGLLPSFGILDERAIPKPNESFDSGVSFGVGHECGISWSRMMPQLFVSTSTTFDLRLSWMRFSQNITATGMVWGRDSFGDFVEKEVRQRTVGRVDVIGVGARLAFDRQLMGESATTITIGGTVGHILGIDYRTSFDPPEEIPLSEFGLPTTGPTPDRRYLFATLHLGMGGRFSLGPVERSVTIAPDVELQIPMSSFLKERYWLQIGLRLGFSVRFPQ